MSKVRPVTLLVILDGFGFSEKQDNNAIALAQAPVWKRFINQYPNCLIQTSGESVGLPKGQMGNSEVGHMTIGSGRVIYQDLPRINRSIEEGDFIRNEVLSKLLKETAKKNSTLHMLGLLSEGGVHSHEHQIHAAIQACQKHGLQKLKIHAFLDGRDKPPKSAERSLIDLEDVLKKAGVGEIASISGRFFAMDRDQRWDRTELAFKAIALGRSSTQANSAVQALKLAYDRGETDEFVKPTLIRGNELSESIISDADSILMMNFRADRARQITRCLTDQNFNQFERGSYHVPSTAATLTRYADDIRLPVLFDRENHLNTLGEYLGGLKMKQLRIAETEKYAHVTFFFSGGREEPFPGETRILIPSPKVETYDLQPQMSAREITDKIIESIISREFDLIIANYANGDMVGHTGKLEPTVTAIEVLDECMGKLESALTAGKDQMLITSDHGNAEQMADPVTEQEHTAHTNNLVPLVYVGSADLRPTTEDGSLSDIAPTLLDLMELNLPDEMTGKPLFENK